MTSDLKSHHFHHFHIRISGISHISLRQTHWTEKPVADMTTRDWRIFREDSGNSGNSWETPWNSCIQWVQWVQWVQWPQKLETLRLLWCDFWRQLQLRISRSSSVAVACLSLRLSHVPSKSSQIRMINDQWSIHVQWSINDVSYVSYRNFSSQT